MAFPPFYFEKKEMLNFRNYQDKTVFVIIIEESEHAFLHSHTHELYQKTDTHRYVFIQNKK